MSLNETQSELSWNKMRSSRKQNEFLITKYFDGKFLNQNQTNNEKLNKKMLKNFVRFV